VAALVAMAGGLSSPLEGEDGSARRGEAEALADPGEGSFTLPRRLHRAILRLLRPAESAVRRLIIVASRGLVVTLPPPRPRKPTPPSIFLRKPGGTGIYLPPGVRLSAQPPRKARRNALPLLDPLPRTLSLSKGHRRWQAQASIPRISFPGVTAPSPITPRLPPAPDDRLDATRLALRLQALAAALDDLPGQAKRFARWRARKQAGRDAAGAQSKNQTRRSWPLRPGRAPGQRPANRRRHEVFEVLGDVHWLAFEVLERRDTS
jgi:hypothetical protein